MTVTNVTKYIYHTHGEDNLMEKMIDVKDNIKEVERMVLEDVGDYWETYEQPVQLSALHKRCARRMKYIPGTLVEFIKKMQAAKKLKVVITKKMARYIFPLNEWMKLSDRDKVEQLNQLNGVNAGSELNKEDENVPVSNYFDKNF